MRPIAVLRILTLALLAAPALRGQAAKPRARDLGVPFAGTPGPLNAITDVAGVEVGHSTIIRGSGKLEPGRGPVRTGVTAILPRGRASGDPVMAGWWSLNGNGEMTGTTWIEESGFLAGPVMITNTHSVGIVRDAVIQWQLKSGHRFDWALPVVAETWDGVLNDLNGFHVTKEHAFEALDGARGGRVAEGNVGGGTGMICHWFKGGIGTASRRLTTQQGGWTVGVLVQCNYGSRAQLRIAGAPVGEDLVEPRMCFATPALRPADARAPACAGPAPAREEDEARAEMGSIIIVVATDAPLLPHQLKRLARRTALGLGRMGSTAGNGSGDIFVAFSTANPGADSAGVATVKALGNASMDPLFGATVQATEEAIVNVLVAAETMTGIDDFRVPAIPHDRLRETLRKYNRLTTP